MKMKKAVIFDLDGTLLNTIQDLAEACNYALCEIGLPLHDVDSYKQMLGNGKYKLMERMLPKGYEKLSELAIKYYETYYQKNCLKHTQPYDGICDLLDDLKKRHFKLGVLSNKSNDLTNKVISYFFPNTFDYIIGGDIGFPSKPDPTQLNNIVTNMKIDKEDVLYVGDSDTDVMTAKNAEIECCGVLWGYRNKENVSKHNPDHIVTDIKELKEVLCL